jgi:hypothetical protein
MTNTSTESAVQLTMEALSNDEELHHEYLCLVEELQSSPDEPRRRKVQQRISDIENIAAGMFKHMWKV